jgi:hypothetical protein
LTIIIVTIYWQEPSQSQDFGLDYEMSEEDQMMRAIALSLGQDVSPMAVDQVCICFKGFSLASMVSFLLAIKPT